MLASAELVPEHPRQAERLYNAAVCLASAGRRAEAQRARAALVKAHPDSDLTRWLVLEGPR